ncbi:putative bHLH domain-containing protein C3F10.12c [Ceratocystis platani]|uniref:Putative bHLH domain-containing protein C3F10.12c n=1 Tax=Ceratocystis fimbriata f. sp. platani TaxID=88771 RepID=A0A0F8B4D7_CERFI|nr:putative bHLH domain-containing protein C3F10.12c [Ceratocystis platani]
MGDITENVDFLKSASPSPNSKRKRDFGDSPEEQRKRSVTATTASTTTPLIGADAPNLSFIESAVEAAAAANGTGITNAATVAALTALQQATRDANESHEQTSLAMNVEHSHSHSPLTHAPMERRRRETINEGINELAKIVPQCEKNKGSILQKAVQFIQQLKANEASNIEKWTLEKLLTEQAIGELSQSNEKLKAECERLYRELETYKRMCQSAGLEIPSKQQDTGVPTTTA